jgi:L-lactate dehydrogenase complex protein LldF
MDFFRERIRQSIQNEALQAALDQNAERRTLGRIHAFQSIPDWRERRKRAHAIRAEVIDQLDEYLATFISINQQNGILVYQAKDAAEANQIVLDIAGATSAALIAKSKSMVSEEIHLNRALEAEGIRVVETDLGEYIVQLRNEKPAHIITPAVHLRRHEIGRLFQEKLGIPYTEDIPTLTNTARKLLREVFFTADIGVSGVNFGIAETGALCLVTNEGNGRMVTTLPKTHIALMGIERLLPTLDDLTLFLSLLPRSATTQKLSVYTQLLRKPLPHQTRHLILLDNGRRRLRNSPLRESLYCIRCGACLNACPVFREIGGHGYVGKDESVAPYPGPIGSVVSPGLLGDNFVHLAQASTLCGACKEACPVDIDLPRMLTRVRAGQAVNMPPEIEREGTGLSLSSKFFLHLYSRIARSPGLYAASQRFAALGSFLLAPRSFWVQLPAATGWGYSKDFPRFAKKSFRQRFKSIKRQPGTQSEAPSRLNTGVLINNHRKNSPPADLSTQFEKELTALGGQVHKTQNVTRGIIQFLRTREIHEIILEPEVLNEALLQEAGIFFTREPDPRLRVGVTKALCGLADTGSILEAQTAAKSLHASLLPEIHIAVLDQSVILSSLPDAMPLVRDMDSAVFITGPSRTADIEMTLTIGVHGPGEVHIFLSS